MKRDSAPLSIPRDRHERLFKLSMKLNGYRCPIAWEQGKLANPSDLHHSGMPNTKTNRLLYPDVVHSIFNVVAVNHDYHMANGRWGQRRGYLWAARLQAFLEKPCHSKICAWANGKV